jgi:hypothetical protein
MPGEVITRSRLCKRRKEMGLSLRDLAERTQLTASFLSQAERGVTNPLFVRYRPEMTFSESIIVYELLTPDHSGKFEVVYGHLKPVLEIPCGGSVLRPKSSSLSWSVLCWLASKKRNTSSTMEIRSFFPAPPSGV